MAFPRTISSISCALSATLASCSHQPRRRSFSGPFTATPNAFCHWRACGRHRAKWISTRHGLRAPGVLATRDSSATGLTSRAWKCPSVTSARPARSSADDLLPFTKLYDEQQTEFTNVEFYKMLNPANSAQIFTCTTRYYTGKDAQMKFSTVPPHKPDELTGYR